MDEAICLLQALSGEKLEVARQRVWAEVAVSVAIWTVPIIFAVLLFLRRWKLARYMRRRHSERWRAMGGRRFLCNESAFGAFLFDPEDDEGDQRLRRLKSGVLRTMLMTFLSVVGAFILNIITDRYLVEWLGM